MPADPYRYFRLEAREILDQLGEATLELEKSGGGEPVRRLLRLAHTLKGAARVVKQPDIADSAHRIEDVLSPFRDAEGAVPRTSVDAVLRHIDRIGGCVAVLTDPAAPPAPVAAAPAVADEPIRIVRAEIAEMDALLGGVTETHALVGGLRTTLRAVETVQHLAELIAQQLAPHRSSAPLRRAEAAQTAYDLADDLRRGIGSIERRLGSAFDQIDRELQQLRATAEQMRLAGCGALFTALERTARDTAHALAKEIRFESRGGETRLDADILANVQGAMVQLVRNAAAHGIESPDTRRRAGKPAAGHIAVEVARRGDRIVFTCRDDGGGIDLDRVRQAALRRGMPAAAAAGLGAAELMQLLLHGGISTADAVTELAGRGIGLDIVRAATDRLGGTVDVVTEPGGGTRFELAVPLSLVSVEALVVETAATLAAIPLASVRGTLLLDGDAVSRGAAGATIVYGDAAIPFLWLPQALDGDRLPPGRKWPVVVVESPAGMAAIGVTGLRGTARVVVHPLPELARASALVAGAWFDAEGNPQLVLSPEELATEARRSGPDEPEPEAERHKVLVIDDSLTTRMLEQSILESAGYEVDLAVSAEEALETARRQRYALFLVDVEMPGMSGFDFVEHTRADPALHAIPSVLVTSRAAPEDRQRGRDAGACGYIVKGEFDQTELLAMIRPLIG